MRERKYVQIEEGREGRQHPTLEENSKQLIWGIKTPQKGMESGSLVRFERLIEFLRDTSGSHSSEIQTQKKKIDRQAEIDKYTQTDSQTDMKIDRRTDKRTDKHRHSDKTQTRHTKTQTGRKIDWYIYT